jgi:hypothetical protein
MEAPRPVEWEPRCISLPLTQGPAIAWRAVWFVRFRSLARVTRTGNAIEGLIAHCKGRTPMARLAASKPAVPFPHAVDANSRWVDDLNGGAGMYSAHISLKGPVKYGQLPGSIGVYDSLDDPMPIGIASCRGWGVDGLAVWTLKVGGQETAGRWVIIDRQFRPAQ